MWIPLCGWRYYACIDRLARIANHKVFVQHETTRNGTLLNWSSKSLAGAVIGGYWDSEIPRENGLSGVVLIKLNYVGGNQRQITGAVHCASWCKAITQTCLWQPPYLFTDDQRQGWLAVLQSNCMLITRAVEWGVRHGQTAQFVLVDVKWFNKNRWVRLDTERKPFPQIKVEQRIITYL